MLKRKSQNVKNTTSKYRAKHPFAGQTTQLRAHFLLVSEYTQGWGWVTWQGPITMFRFKFYLLVKIAE